MAHGFSHLTARKRVRAQTSGGLKQPRIGRPKAGRPPGSKDPAKGRGTVPSGGMKPKPSPTRADVRRKKAVDYVIARRGRRGQTVNRKEARHIVKKNIKSDKRATAYKYDFAGDGAGKKDKDYGTAAWKRYRRNKGLSAKTKNRKNHGGGNGNKGPNNGGGNKGDSTNSADDAGNSQSGDSYGGPQSLSAAERTANRDAKRAKRRARRKRRNHSGSSG